MARKDILAPTVLLQSQSLAANFTSPPTVVAYMDNIAYQIDVNTTDDAGTFSVQASLDYVPSDGIQTGVAGTWIDLTLSGVPTVASANDDIMIDLNQLPFQAIRLAYMSGTPGTGTAKVTIMSKQVGG